MERFKYLFWFFMLVSVEGRAQVFLPVVNGPVVTGYSDSRSVNLVDVNGDGWDDIFISNGPYNGDTNFLFLNNANGTFSPASGGDLGTISGGFDGATFADPDNDGDLDFFVVTWYNQPNYFFLNDSHGVFTHQPTALGGSQGTYSETASWADYDNDGWVDLYLTNSALNLENQLFHNQGNGSFVQVNSGALVTDAAPSRNASWADYDNDGDPDLYVTNESNQANALYRNDGGGLFTKLTNLPPVAATLSSMSSSWGDVDNDLDLDLFVANAGTNGEQNNLFYLNDGQGNLSAASGGQLTTDGGCNYSSTFVDYDNDADLDLFVTSAFCQSNPENFLYDNDGTGNFSRNTTALAGLSPGCTYGAAWADLDHNGFPDLVMANCQNNYGQFPIPEPNSLLMNQGNGNHWLDIRLEGVQSNRAAIGARVYVTATINGQPVTQMREVSAQDGYCSQNSLAQHFGLGSATSVDLLWVQWPSGVFSQLSNPPVDTTLVVAEGTGQSLPEGSGSQVRILVRQDQPGQARLTLLNPELEPLDSILLVDLSGKVLLKKELGTPVPELGLDLQGLPAGYCLARVQALAGQVVVQPVLLR